MKQGVTTPFTHDEQVFPYFEVYSGLVSQDRNVGTTCATATIDLEKGR